MITFFSHSKVKEIVKAMLGNRLITKQTGADGAPVNSVMIAQSVDIFEEKYLCFLLDRYPNPSYPSPSVFSWLHGILRFWFIQCIYCLFRDHSGPVCIASPAGGVDIEEVASSTPEKIKTVPIDIMKGLSANIAKEIATFLEFKGPLVDQVIFKIKVYR